MKVALFVFNHANADLRTHRQAHLLAQNGYEVRVYCFLEPGLPQREQRGGYLICREDQRSQLTRFFDDQIMRKLKPSKPPRAETGELPKMPPDQPPVRPCPEPPPRQLPKDFLPGEEEYLAYVARINAVWTREATAWKPDICHAQDLDALQAAYDTAQAVKARLILDSHELWTDQPFIRSQATVDYWDALEARLVPHCQAVMTVSRPFAEVLQKRLQREVLVLHNCQEYQPLPPRSTALQELARGRPVALYQGVFGIDRGLEQLVASAQYQKEVVVALRGFGSAQAGLEHLAQGLDNVLLLERCPPEQMIEKAAEADMGVIPFLPTCLNHYLNTPNKMFEYMLAGLPISAADLPDLRHFVETEQMGNLFDPFSPRDIARALVELWNDPEREAKGSRAHAACKRRWNWECEGRQLLECYQTLARV